MPIMDHLKAAEADLTEFSSVAEEIATLASGGLATLKAHRDRVKVLVEQAVGASQGIGGVAVTMKAATVPAVPPAPQPPPAPAPSAGPAPDWSALQGQAASLPG